MSRRKKPLVEFDAVYYRYPTVTPGLLVIDLEEFEFPKRERENREEWFVEAKIWCRTDFHKLIYDNFFDISDERKLVSLLKHYGSMR